MTAPTGTSASRAASRASLRACAIHCSSFMRRKLETRGGECGAIAVIVRSICRVRRGIGGLERATPQRGPRRGPEVGKRADTDRGQQCRSVGGTFLTIHRAYGETEDLGLDASKKRALRAAPREEQARRVDAEVGEDGERVAQGKTDALDDGARHVIARMRETQAEERATRIG